MERNFDFGPGEPVPGYEGVTPDCQYTAELGYGFEDTSRVYGRIRTPGGSDEVATLERAGNAQQEMDISVITPRLRSSFCIPVGAVFVVDVPDGTYQVKVIVGDELAETHTLIKAVEGKRVLPAIRTAPGQYAEERFSVAVRGGRLRLIISGKAPRLNALQLVQAPQTMKLFLAGDSTVTDQAESGYPYAGWGQTLPALFKHDVCVDNHAISGRSSRSFIQEGRLDVILKELKAGDFLFIQFGHNDEKNDPARGTEPFTTYKEHLRRYIDGARAKDARPVLITPIQRRYFESDGTLSDTHGDYTVAVRELAEECEVPLFDLAERSRQLFEQAGVEGTKDIFMWVLPGEYLNFSSGVEDNTHFQESGAIRIAQLAADWIRQEGLQPLLMYLR